MRLGSGRVADRLL